MSWTYQDQLVETLPEDCVGFVYIITNLTNGRKYIGKKLAKLSKTTYKSDWQEYWGSSPNLQADIDALGTDNFSRQILFYCTSKAECSYIEAREQFSRRVLESDEYYNGHIQVRVHGSHIKGKIQLNG